MNYIPADKLIAEIGHSKIRRYVDPYSESYEGGFNDGYNECCDDVLKVIASLRQEPPSLPSNLDEAALDYAELCKYEGGDKLLCAEHFKAGAEWMAGQGVKATATVGYYNQSGLSILTEPNIKKLGFKKGDELEITIRKK